MSSLARRELSADECAIVVQRRGEPLLVRGPARVRTFWRCEQVGLVHPGPPRLDTPGADAGPRDGSGAGGATLYASGKGYGIFCTHRCAVAEGNQQPARDFVRPMGVLAPRNAVEKGTRPQLAPTVRNIRLVLTNAGIAHTVPVHAAPLEQGRRLT